MTKHDHAAEIAQMAADMLVLAPREAAKFENELRARFGGASLRIAPTPPVTPEVVDAGLRARKPVAVIATELGVSRATIYRLLHREKSQVARKRDTAQR